MFFFFTWNESLGHSTSPHFIDGKTGKNLALITGLRPKGIEESQNRDQQ